MTLLAYVGVLLVVLAGIAIMVQLVSVEDAAKYLGRGVVALLLIIVAICMLRTLILQMILPSVLSGLTALRSIIGWVLIAALVLGALIAVYQVVRKRFE